MVPVVYGLPGIDLFEARERGEVILGGCVPKARRWGCVACGPKPFSEVWWRL